MGYYRCGSGVSAEDGNDVLYPVTSPSSNNKLYIENDINNIALAIGQSLKVEDMANAVRQMSGGLRSTRYILHTEAYTEVNI